jgi:hypothetical protein
MVCVWVSIVWLLVKGISCLLIKNIYLLHGDISGYLLFATPIIILAILNQLFSP